MANFSVLFVIFARFTSDIGLQFFACSPRPQSHDVVVLYWYSQHRVACFKLHILFSICSYQDAFSGLWMYSTMRNFGQGSALEPLGDVTVFPRPSSCIGGSHFTAGKEMWMEGRGTQLENSSWAHGQTYSAWPKGEEGKGKLVRGDWKCRTWTMQDLENDGPNRRSGKCKNSDWVAWRLTL